MAKNDIEYNVKVDASGATSGFDKVGKAAKDAAQDVEKAFTKAGTESEQAFDKAIAGLKKVSDESKATIRAVGKIGEAFGEGFDPDAASRLINSLRKAGAEFDTIEGKADQLATTMRELDGVKLDAASQGIRNLDDGLGETSDAARGANSALANMVGNTTQDVGALGGVVGSAGVLIGQMGEYIADATLGGQKFSTVLKDFTKILGPVAAIAAAASLVKSVMSNLGAEAERSAGNVDALVEAMDGASVSATDLMSSIQIRPELLEIPESVTVSWEDFGDSVSAVVNGVLPFLGSELDTVDVANIFDKANISIAAFSRGVTGTVDDLGTLEAALLEAKEAGIISNDEYLNGLHAIDLAIGDVADAETEAAKAREMFAVDGAAAQELMAEAMRASLDPLEQYTHQWAALMDALRSTDERLTPGQLADESDAAAAAINTLSKALDMSPTDVVALAWERLNEGIDANAELTKASAEEMAEAAAAAAEMTAAVGDLTESIADINSDDLDNLTSGFEDALNAAGDLSNFKFRIDFDEAMSGADGFLEKFSGEFKPDILELAEFMQTHLGVNVSDSITWGEVDKDDPEFASLVVDMTSMIKEGAAKAYAEGGEEAAHAFVQAQAQALVAAVPGLTTADVYRLLGLPDDGSLDAIIKPIIDAEAKADALATLAALAGVDPDNPIIAYLTLGVQTGSVDPVIAEVAALLLAGQYGVNVDAQLKEFTPQEIAAAQAQIDNSGGVTIPGQVEIEKQPLWDSLFPATPAPVVVPAVIEAPNLDDVNTLINAVADQRRTANIDVKADDAGKVDKLLDGIAAAERTASIVAEAHTLDAVTGLNILTNAERIADVEANPTNIGPADAALDGIAQRRQAPIIVVLPNASEADRVLNRISEDRYADIFVRTHNTVTTSNAGPIPGSPGTLDASPAGFAADDELGINPLAGAATTSLFGTPVSVAGTTVAPTVHNHVTIQAAVIGSRFDVQRAVSRALRQAQRLNGTRAA